MIKVTYLKQECLACPTLYSGEDIEGNEVHVRYRGGRFSVRHKEYNNIVYSVDHGDEFDGFFNEQELHEWTKGVLDLTEAEIESYPPIDLEESISNLEALLNRYKKHKADTVIQDEYESY